MKVTEIKKYTLTLTEREHTTLSEAVDLLSRLYANDCESGELFNAYCEDQSYNWDSMIVDSFDRLATLIEGICDFAEIEGD